jgi:2-iminobutanoate/2-iminopropanoate deaminase
MTVALQRSAIEPKNPLLNASRSSNLPDVPGIRVGDYIFLSGMTPVDPHSGERSHGPIAEQVRTTLSNMQHMLESAGSSLERVVRVHVVLADISQMAEMDRVYTENFSRSTRRRARPGRCSFGSATVARSNALRWRAERVASVQG